MWHCHRPIRHSYISSHSLLGPQPPLSCKLRLTHMEAAIPRLRPYSCGGWLATPELHLHLPATTGQSIFAEGLRICRGKMLGHSAKSLCRGPDPRQRTALGKDSLPRAGPSARQAHGNNNYLPRAPRQHRLTRRPSPAVNLCRGHHR